MRKALSILLLTLWGLMSQCQVVLERQAITCFGLNVSGEYTLLSTAGQVEFTTATNGSFFLTQGFEQTDSANFLQPQFNIFHDACNDQYNVDIVSLNGCPDTSGVVVLWNGVPGGLSAMALSNPASITINTTSGCAYDVLIDFESMAVQELPCELQFYTFLSPNQDGSNDTWLIHNVDNEYFSQNSVTFFNRWGSKIWEGKNYDNNNVVWKGQTSSGEDLPDGTYFFMMKANGTEYQGYVELMR